MKNAQTNRSAFYFPFSKERIAKLPIPEKGRVIYHDTEENGLCLIVGYGGSKVYYMYAKCGRVPLFRKIAAAENVKSIDELRKEAATIRAGMAKGKDPAETQKQDKSDITLKDFYNGDYMTRHAKSSQSKGTIYVEASIFRSHIEPLLGNKKLRTIRRETIERVLDGLKFEGKDTTAGRVLIMLKTIFNKAVEWGRCDTNPTKGITPYKFKSRDRFIQPEEMPRFFAALDKEPNERLRDYILIALYTGQRKRNVLAYRWDNIDFENKTLYIPMTKNGEPQRIPLPSQAVEILERIRETNKSEWVFPSDTSASGHLEEPKKAWKRLLKNANLQNLRIHDLRRTLGSIQAINGTSLQIIGKSLGHKTPEATQIYARLTLDPVRESMQKATDKMLEYRKI